MNDPPTVFVSYAHEDLPTVAWEADTMRLGGIDVFLDFQSMRTGADWPDTLLKAVCNASRFILFWSRFSAESDWVRNECAEALRIRAQRDDDSYFQIIKLDDTPLPKAFENIQYLDRSREALLILASDTKKIAFGWKGLNEILSSGMIVVEKMTPRTTRVIAHEAGTLVSGREDLLMHDVRAGEALPQSLKLPAWTLRDESEAAYRPLVLIPTLLGSSLARNGALVWLNIMKLMSGGIGQLRIGSGGVEAVSPVGSVYGSFIEQTRLSLPVVPCPYDWRLSFRDSVRSLARLTESLLAGRDAVSPVFMAHGSGNFLVRALAAYHPDLWLECRIRGARLIFLGAAENGTYDAAEMLTGSSALLRKLAMLDLRHTSRQVTDIFRGYPGLWELLPKGPEQDLLNPDYWADTAWHVDDDVLRLARERRQEMAAALASEDIHYVYGSAKTTLAHMTIEGSSIRKAATSMGDGLTPYDLNFPRERPKNLYVARESGNSLLASPVVGRAVVDLAIHGRTTVLSHALNAIVR